MCHLEMPCHEEGGRSCPINNWCVCEWALASYVDKEGCDAVRIHCDATNRKVIDHYARASSSPRVESALSCVMKQCAGAE